VCPLVFRPVVGEAGLEGVDGVHVVHTDSTPPAELLVALTLLWHSTVLDEVGVVQAVADLTHPDVSGTMVLVGVESTRPIVVMLRQGVLAHRTLPSRMPC
jgi:hypothetical protein